jgi:hypothetical protein
MANYDKMSVPELEQERERIEAKMMASDDNAEIELLSQEIEVIEDILSERDPLAEE